MTRWALLLLLDSGSGLLDDQGRVIGIVSAMTSANGCTFGLSL